MKSFSYKRVRGINTYTQTTQIEPTLTYNMYTAPTASRAEALRAAAAADRAMKRSVCCKSHYKFKCFSCGEMIHRGDKITVVHGGEGMTLRYRGADSTCGLTMEETVFYQPSTGSKRWVHIGCNPCHWHNGGCPCGEPHLYGVWTEWSSKIQSEFDEDYALTGHYDMEEFLDRRGYPQEKYQTDRVKAAVAKFQALWRGFIARNVLSSPSLSASQPPTFQEGDRGEILFDQGTLREAIYGFRVVHKWTSKEDGSENFVVYFQSDDTYNNYTRSRLVWLTQGCAAHKRRLGIEQKIVGKLSTLRRSHHHSINNAHMETWRYTYPDGTVVE